jgi:hypothetical protein
MLSVYLLYEALSDHARLFGTNEMVIRTRVSYMNRFEQKFRQLF